MCPAKSQIDIMALQQSGSLLCMWHQHEYCSFSCVDVVFQKINLVIYLETKLKKVICEFPIVLFSITFHRKQIDLHLNSDAVWRYIFDVSRNVTFRDEYHVIESSWPQWRSWSIDGVYSELKRNKQLSFCFALNAGVLCQNVL